MCVCVVGGGIEIEMTCQTHVIRATTATGVCIIRPTLLIHGISRLSAYTPVRANLLAAVIVCSAVDIEVARAKTSSRTHDLDGLCFEGDGEGRPVEPKSSRNGRPPYAMSTACSRGGVAIALVAQSQIQFRCLAPVNFQST